MSFEEIEIEGYLGKDPEYPQKKDFPFMLTFSVGVSQSYKKKNSSEYEKKTTWYHVISNSENQSAYLHKYLQKGDKVVVKGKPLLKVWNSKEGNPNGMISIMLNKCAIFKKTDDSEAEQQQEVVNNHPAKNLQPKANNNQLKDNQLQVQYANAVGSDLGYNNNMYGNIPFDDEIPF